MISYHKPPAQIDDVLKLIAKTPTGRALLEAFLPLHAKKTVRFESYPAPLVERLRAVVEEGQPIGACFSCDGTVGAIHYDPSSPIGVLAPFLVHEIAHALDPALWRRPTADATGPAKKRANDPVQRELGAFETQFRFTSELKDRDPDYEKFLRAYYPKARILHERLSFELITELYGETPGARRAS